MTEPWCWPPDVVAGLTPRQVELIIERQQEKVKAANPGGERAGGGGGRMPSRQKIIETLMGLGRTREQAEEIANRAEPVG